MQDAGQSGYGVLLIFCIVDYGCVWFVAARGCVYSCQLEYPVIYSPVGFRNPWAHVSCYDLWC